MKEAAWDTWERLGAPSCITAPMVDGSDAAFRVLTRRHGAHLCFTPMLHSAMLTGQSTYQRRMMKDVRAGDRPLVGQLCGNDVETVVAAARMIEPYVDAVDLNLGCPQMIAKRGNYGAFLLEQHDLVCAMIDALVQNLSVPVTAKIRILPDLQDTLTLVKRLEALGCAIITVHGRTRDMIRDDQRVASFQAIRTVKEALSIPVVANGNVEYFSDLKEALDQTGADGIMSAEGVLCYPALFEGPHAISRLQLSAELLELAEEYDSDLPNIRGHLIKFLYPYLWKHNDLRMQIATCRHRDHLSVLLKQLEDLVQEHGLDFYADCPTWYRRHRHKDYKKKVREFQPVNDLAAFKVFSIFEDSDESEDSTSHEEAKEHDNP